MDTFMENSAPSNVWTYCARWHRYFATLIETNIYEISCLLCMSFCFVILYVAIWCKKINWLSIYLAFFMQENPSCHTSKLKKGWLDQQKILTMKLLTYSPDFNSIEHIWAWIKGWLHKKKDHIINLDLERKSRELWSEVDCAMFEKRFQHISRRMDTVINTKGRSIRYWKYLLFWYLTIL